jgi:hypothetical protein
MGGEEEEEFDRAKIKALAEGCICFYRIPSSNSISRLITAQRADDGRR